MYILYDSRVFPTPDKSAKQNMKQAMRAVETGGIRKRTNGGAGKKKMLKIWRRKSMKATSMNKKGRTRLH